MIFKNINKGISPVVAIALLLVVAVVAVVGFQSWFGSFNSEVFADVEQKGETATGGGRAGVETISGDTIYIKNPGSSDIEIKSVKVNGVDCDEAVQNISSGVHEVKITSCLSKLSGSQFDVVVITDEEIIAKKIFIDDFVPPTHCLTNGTNGFAGGDGSSGNPYQICNCEQFQNISQSLSSDYELISNVDCSDFAGFSPIEDFTGVLDGNFYTISNLVVSGSDDVGIFLSIRYPVEIKNLRIKNAEVSGQNRVGGLTASDYGSHIDNVSFEGNVSGLENVGALIGRCEDGVYIDSSFAKANINSQSDSAGLIGSCVVGASSISNSYFIGNITGDENDFAGFIFEAGSLTIEDCYVAVTIGNYAFIKNDDMNTFNNNFYDSDLASGFTLGATGQTTAEMKTAQTFIDDGWDTSIWNLQDGQYPKLAWE